MLEKIKNFVKKNKKLMVTASAIAVTTLPTFASATSTTPNTGNTDLDTLINNMTSGLDSIKVGGLYIISAIIVIAVVFLGGRWLWNLFRSWLSRAA